MYFFDLLSLVGFFYFFHSDFLSQIRFLQMYVFMFAYILYSPIILLMPQVKINSHILCIRSWLSFFLWLSFLDQMFLDFTVFYLTLESARKIHEKCGGPPLAKIQIIMQIYLTVSYMKRIFIYFTHLRHCYYDKLFQITLS